MYPSSFLYLIILGKNVFSEIIINIGYNNLVDHTIVTDSAVLPYVAAILKKSTYISAGALISDRWVITDGDSLFLFRENARQLRVRLGSINNKKGGTLLPIKKVEIHPYFRDTNPEYDIALIKLPHRVRFSTNIYPIRVQTKPNIITATHFIVTSWSTQLNFSESVQKVVSMDTIKRHRILTVSHLHPSDPDRCLDEMSGMEIHSTNTLMCLDLPPDSKPCARDVGAPVVLNGILWGIISSYQSDDCAKQRLPSFVNLVSAPEIRSWIHAVVRGHGWYKPVFRLAGNQTAKIVKKNEPHRLKVIEFTTAKNEPLF